MIFFFINYCCASILISNSSVAIYENINIVITGDYKDTDIVFDNPKDISVIKKNGESTRSSISITNGKMTKETYRSLNYSLIFQKQGIYKISIQAGNEKKFFNIEVFEKNTREDIFFEVMLNENELYPGLEGKIEYYLYAHSALSLQGLENKFIPKGKNVAINWVNTNKKDHKKEKINKNDKEYYRYKVLEGYITSYQEGSFEVSPLVIDVVFAKQDTNLDNFFDLFLGVEQKKITIQSKEVFFSTKSFPNPIPKNFLKILSTKELSADFSINLNKVEENKQVFATFSIANEYKGSINAVILQKIIFEDCYNSILFTSSNQEIVNERNLISWNMSSLGNCSLEEKNIEIHFFNPELKEYQKFFILRPSLTIEKEMLESETDLKKEMVSTRNNFSMYLNRFIKILHKALLISFMCVGLYFFFKFIFFRKKEKYSILLSNFLKQPNYKNFLLIMLFLSKNQDVNNVFVHFKYKEYFVQLKDALFAFKDHNNKKFIFKKNRKAFKELEAKMKLL